MDRNQIKLAYIIQTIGHEHGQKRTEGSLVADQVGPVLDPCPFAFRDSYFYFLMMMIR
jgi:hypothetical protein